MLEEQQRQIDGLLENPGDDSDSSEPTFALDDFLGGGEAEERNAKYGSGSTVVDFHGFLHFVYAQAEGSPSVLDLYHANLFFGADLGEHAQGWVELEYEHSGSEVELDQAEIRFFLGETTTAFGRFYAPFGIERRTWYPSKSEMESRPDIYRYVVPGNWYETGGRVDHLQEFGDWKLRAEFAVTNGLDSAANTDLRGSRQHRDNNNNKALIGRLGVSPTEKATFGVSAATMKYSGDDSIDFIGVDFEYHHDRWLLRGEGIQSSVDDSGSGDFKRKGYYLLGSYKIPFREEQSFVLAGRYDVLDGNDTVVDSRDYSAYSFTASWLPRSNIAIRGEVRSFSSRHGATLAGDYALMLGVILDF